MLYHTIHTAYPIYTVPAHTVIYYDTQYSAYIYTHTLIYSDTTTTPSHDLLLLHQDIHIIPVYTSPSAIPYIYPYIQWDSESG